MYNRGRIYKVNGEYIPLVITPYIGYYIVIIICLRQVDV